MITETRGTRYKAVILTALPVEFRAVVEHLERREECTHPKGTIYEKGYFQLNESQEWEVVVAEVGAGNSSAALEIERALDYHRPDVAIFVGVAGGVKDVVLGDVVVGSRIYSYESGKEAAQGFKSRPATVQSSYRLLERAKAEARKGAWVQRIKGRPAEEPPRALIGPIAAGEKVVADASSKTADLIASNFGDALAVEMEGYGFSLGAHSNERNAIVIRGISDLLSGKAEADRSGSQEIASRNASAFCFEFLSKLGGCGQDASETSDGSFDGTKVVARRISPDFVARGSNTENCVFAMVADPADENEDPRFVAKMNTARDLLEKGHGRAARSLLTELSREVRKKGFSTRLRFRLEINLGVADLILEDYASAEDHFVRAHYIEPDNPKALSNRAQVAIARNRPDEAIKYAEKAWRLQPSDSNAGSIYLRSLAFGGFRQKVQELENQHEWMRGDVRCVEVLALFAFDEKRFDEAESLARKALSSDPDNAQLMELLARCVLVPIQADLDSNPPLPGRIPTSTKERILEALELFDRSIGILDGQDYRRLLHAAVANRGTSLTVLGRFDEALQCFDRVLAEDPRADLVRINKGRVLLVTDRPQEAIVELTKVDNSMAEAAWQPLAAAYLAARQPEKAIAVVMPHWTNAGAGQQYRIRSAELLLAAFVALHDPIGGAAIADELMKCLPNDPEALATVADWKGTQPGGRDEASTLLYRALDLCNDDRQRDRISLLLADCHFKKEEFSEAADFYAKVAPYLSHLGLQRRYLASLFQSGSLRQALTFARELRRDQPAIPGISHFEARILESFGELPEAERLYVELQKLEPDNPDHGISIAYIRYRQANYEGAKEAVLKLGIDEARGTPHQLMTLAKMRAWLDLDGVLSLAHRARRVGYGDPDIHSDYIGLLLHVQRDCDTSLIGDEVRPGTVVHVETADGQKKVITVVDGLDADLHRGELLPSDPTARKLLGHRAGETVTIRKTELSTSTLRIDKIESQYAFAYAETLANYSTWFPEAERTIERFRVDDSGLSQILHVTNSQASHAQQVLDLYDKRKLTMGMTAKLLGRSTFRVWEGLRDGSGTRIWASNGNDQSANLERSLLQTSDALVIDLTGLLTFAVLNLLDVLKARFGRILTSPFVLDEVRDELTLERSGLHAHGWLSANDGRLVCQEQTERATATRLATLNALLVFIKKDTDQIGTSKLLEVPENIKQSLGQAAIGPILIAKENNAVLLSDDLVMREVASQEWNVGTACSQSILLHLRERGHISDDDYRRAVIALVSWNYHFLKLNEHDYMWLLGEDRFRLTPRLTSALRVLSGPDCTDDSAVIVAGAFIKSCWLESRLRSCFPLVIDAVVSAVKRGRQPVTILSKLDACVQRTMGLTPEGLNLARKTIAFWIREARSGDKHAGLG